MPGCPVETFIKQLSVQEYMEIKVLSETKDMLKIKLENDFATLASAVKDELWNTKGVDLATLDKRHPLVGKPELRIEGKEPRKLMKSAAASFKKKVEEFEKAVLKEI